MDECGIWWSPQFLIMRRPNAVRLFDSTKGEALNNGGFDPFARTVLGSVMRLPPKLVERLNALTPEEELTTFLAPRAHALCEHMAVFAELIVPNKLLEPLCKIGTIDAVSE